MVRGMRLLEASCPVEVEYGRRVLDDLTAVGLINVEAEGRGPVVRGGSPPAAHFLRLTLEKLRVPLLEDGTVTEAEFAEAVAALEDPAVTVVMPMTVAAPSPRGSGTISRTFPNPCGWLAAESLRD
jgi:hypothetical protein